MATAGERLAQLRADLDDLDEQRAQVDIDRRLTWLGREIAQGRVPIPDEMLTALAARLDVEDAQWFERWLLILDGWRELSGEWKGWLSAPKKWPGIPKRPPRAVLTSPEERGGSGGSGGGGGGGGAVEVTLEESAAVRLQKQAEIEHMESIADKREWTKRRDTRAWLLRDADLRSVLLGELKELAGREDRAMAVKKVGS